jgi:hypothetical protein
MRLAFALVFGGALPVLALSPPPPFFDNGAQDGNGIIWAFGQSQGDQVFSFDGTQWSEQLGPFKPGQGSKPVAMVRMNDGSIACVWRLASQCIAVTRHTASGSTLLGTGNEPVSVNVRIEPFCDSKNHLWVTGAFPQIYRVDDQGLKIVNLIPEDEYRLAHANANILNAVHLVEDGHGRVWAWAEPGGPNFSSPRSVLIFDGDKPEIHSTLGTIPSPRILHIARADDRHMWVSVANDGIYLVDIDNFNSQREADPAPKALSSVRDLHVAGSDLYAVADYPVFKDALWRRHDGKWTELIHEFDHNPFSFQPRSWLDLPNGILAEGFDTGPWFIPSDGAGPAVEISWKSNFALVNTVALNRLPDGQIFCIGGGGKLFHGPLTLPPKDEVNSRLVWTASERGWMRDARDHIWTILKATPQMLSQWDGEKWTGHQIPLAIPPNQMPTLQGDLDGHVWVMSATRDGGIAIYDPAADRWQTFANLKAAYLGLAKTPTRFQPTGIVDNDPAYSPDGKRVAFRDGVIYLNYYDGTTWQTFRRENIIGKKDGDNAIGPPWFDAGGVLFVNTRNHMSWRLNAPNTWGSVPFQSHFPKDNWSESGGNRGNPYRVEPPEGAITRRPEFCVQDNLGTYWLTWQGQLYRCLPGICVAEFGPGEVSPFIAQPVLNKVFVDEKGNALFGSPSEIDPWLMIRPLSPPPQTQITMRRAAPDSYVAHFDPRSAASGIVFRWQLDAGDWHLETGRDVALNHLPNGPHVLMVTAMDTNLDMQPLPTEAKFSTEIDQGKQIAVLVSQLADPDYTRRKEAVDALSRQPALAIPALRQARISADEEVRWWIDVALQQAQAHQDGSVSK